MNTRSRSRVQNSPERRRWYNIRNVVKTNGATSATIDLYDEIDSFWGVAASDFKADLNKLDVDTINLHINSPGGDVYDGIAIMNALRQHPAKVVTTVDGLAASSASFIAVGGSDEVIMSDNSELMAHEAWAMEVGNAADMQKMADDLSRVSANIASIYASKAGGTVDEWREVMGAETWFTADEAVEAGLADRVDRKASKESTKSAKNAYDLSIFKHAGRSDAPAPAIVLRNSATNSDPSTERVEVTPKGSEGNMPTLNEGLREALGIDDADVTDEVLLENVKTAIAERDEALETATAPAPEAEVQPIAAKAAPGTVTVDADAFADLKAAAELGRQAHARQVREDIENTVDAAVRAGRITPAKRNAWVQRIEADKTEAEVLNALEPTISVDSELGHAGEPPVEAAAENAALGDVFAKITGFNASKEN